MSTCDLCRHEVKDYPTSRSGSIYDCPRCGRVEISYIMSAVLKNNRSYDNVLYKISGVTRYRTENNLEPTVLLTDNIEQIIDEYFVPRNISQKLDLLLKYIGKNSKYTGDTVRLDIVLDYPIAFCKNYDEFQYFLEQLESQGLINSVGEGHNYRVSIDGWNRLDSLNRIRERKKQAFIAMWFTEDLSAIYQNGFQKAIKECGYEPMKIDLKEHNNKIDDEIIAEIKNSDFLIADFTGQRGGVYFEAGFALGLGIPVIWTCQKTDLGKIHFDTRQYNHIEWTNAEELYNKLVNRIKATIEQIK